MNPYLELKKSLNRRHFFGQTAGVGSALLGGAALTSLLEQDGHAAPPGAPRNEHGGLTGMPHHAPKAKRVIYMHQSGAPSQQDLFDNKPKLNELFGKDLRKHIDMNERVTGMTKNQKTFPIAGSKYKFKKHGESGTELSELLPHIAGVADDICLIRSMHTEAINHDPAITFFQTGHQLAGRPSIGAWMSYGLGSVKIQPLLSKGRLGR